MRRFARDDRGNFVVLTALAAPVIMLVIAMSINYSNAVSVQQQTQAAADSAALAATQALANGEVATTGEAETLARSFFNANAPALALQNESHFSAKTTTSAPALGTVSTTVEYQGVIPSLVSSALGSETFEVSATSAIPLAMSTPAEVVQTGEAMRALAGAAPLGVDLSHLDLSDAQTGCEDIGEIDDVDPAMLEALKPLLAGCKESVGSAVTLGAASLTK